MMKLTLNLVRRLRMELVRTDLSLGLLMSLQLCLSLCSGFYLPGLFVQSILSMARAVSWRTVVHAVAGRIHSMIIGRNLVQMLYFSKYAEQLQHFIMARRSA